jgi:hypothetical protein
MASPHVAGVAALYLGSNPTANPTTVKYHILTKTTDGLVVDPGPGSPNQLLYSRITDGSVPPPPPPPGEEPPAAPDGLVATPVSTTQIDLSWSDNSDNEETFEIEWSTNGIDFSLLASEPANTTGYPHVGLTPATRYWYRVRAWNSAGYSPFTGVASTTTEEESAPPGDIEMEVWEISDLDIVPAGKFLYAQVIVAVTEAGNFLSQIPGITVAGDWYWSTATAPVRSSFAVTNTLGIVYLDSGKIKDVPNATLSFCVTSLSGPGFTDVTDYPRCSSDPPTDPGDPPPDPGDPPPDPGDPPPDLNAPSDLSAFWSSKGGGRVELIWTPGGGAEVDVFRFDSSEIPTPIATTADNGRFNDRDGTQTGATYQVCIAGTGPLDLATCTGKVGVIVK